MWGNLEIHFLSWAIFINAFHLKKRGTILFKRKYLNETNIKCLAKFFTRPPTFKLQQGARKENLPYFLGCNKKFYNYICVSLSSPKTNLERIFKRNIKDVASSALWRSVDDAHMTTMKILQFSRASTPLVHLCAKFFHPLDLARPISNEPPTPLQMITNQLNENIIQGWLLYVIKPYVQVGFRFQYELINLVWLSFDFFSFSWSLSICFVVALYSCVCICSKISQNVFCL